MPVPTLITDLSTTAAANYPAGSDSPSTLDDVQRAHAAFVAQLRDGKGFSNSVTVASAATTDIGGASSQFVEVSGTTTITSFGTNYNGPRFLRFTGSLTLTHSAALSLPLSLNIITQPGESFIAIPNATRTGWNVTSFAASSIPYLPSGTGAVATTVQSKLRESVSVKDFGAVGDGVADDTAAIQAAIAATPKNGRLYFPRAKYKISDELRVTQPMLIVGDGPGQILEGYDTTDDGSYIVQTNNAKMAFKLVAGLNNYAFGQYGVCGVHFQDLCIQGRDSANKIVACIGADTTVNGGDFHIRGNSTTRCTLRYAVDTLNFTGVAYLNNFYQTNFIFGTRGVKIARGAASDSGGQTRFFGCLLEFCQDGASLNEDAVNGVFSFFGCTIADNTRYGISTNDEISLELHGNNFENNTTAGVYVLTPSGKANSNSTHFRNICGNEFFSNGASLWFDKQATSLSDGNFNYPTRIDANSFVDALAVKLSVPSGHPGFASTNFVIGASNVGTSNGQLAASQVSSTFFGTDERRRHYSKRFVFTGSYVSGSVIDMLPTRLVVQSCRMYMTANASGFSTFQLGDIASSARYLTIGNAQTQTLNTWVSWTPTVPQLVIDGTNNQFRLIGTGGILGAAGVIEIEGYVQ